MKSRLRELQVDAVVVDGNAAEADAAHVHADGTAGQIRLQLDVCRSAEDSDMQDDGSTRAPPQLRRSCRWQRGARVDAVAAPDRAFGSPPRCPQPILVAHGEARPAPLNPSDALSILRTPFARQSSRTSRLRWSDRDTSYPSTATVQRWGERWRTFLTRTTCDCDTFKLVDGLSRPPEVRCAQTVSLL